MSKTFYQLEADEWLFACNELKPAELKVLYRLRTLDPFGKHPLKFKVTELAKELNLNKGTVSRAVQVLSEKGYISLEIVEAIATLTTKGRGLSVDNAVVSTQQTQIRKVVCTQHERSLHNMSDRYTTSMIATQHDDLQTQSGLRTDLSYISLDQKDYLDQDQEDDFSNFSDSENTEGNLQGLTAIAQIAIQVSKPDTEIEPVETSEASNKKRLPDISEIAIEGDSFRRRVEDFILKEMKFSPRDRTAYFSKFTAQHWQDWESKYKAQFSPSPVAHKIFIPEIVEVAPPDSEAVKDALAQIRKSLGIKVAK
jgi:predicted transcriptional regulator